MRSRVPFAVSIGLDADQGPVELLYRTLRDEGDEKFLSLTMNLADPSPGLGWRGLERKSLPDRGAPLTFSIEVAVRPTAKLGTYKGLEVGRREPTVSDAEVDEEVERLRASTHVGSSCNASSYA